MATNLIDTLLRPRQPSISELVDALRDIHHGKTTYPLPPPALPAHPGGSEPELPSPVPGLILDSVARGIENIARLLAPGLRTGTEANDRAVRQYDALRAQLDRLDRDVRQHAVTVDRLLNRNAPAPGAAAYQETLYLQCPRGGHTTGRFRCVNRRDQRTSVTSSLRPFTMHGMPSAASPMLTIRPGSFALDSGASEIISVEVDLAACPDLVDGDLKTSIDLHMNNAIALKIWVEIHVYERC
jgi:hypothetical protein